MNPGGDAAEQIVRLSLEGVEVAAKISGNGAKNIGLLLYATLKQEQRTKGKARLTNMLKSGKELKVFTIRQEDLIDSSANQQLYLEFSKCINSVLRTLLTPECAVEIGELKKIMNEHEISSLHKFINYLNVLKNDYSDDFKPSNGEQSILLVDAALNNKDCDVILLDEPDSGMGADYINDVLIPEIRDRANENKTIVIVTHDPNMVVRTHPYSCLYRTESDALTYKSYMGSSFEEFMYNPDDINDKRTWVDSVLSICEGGATAFNERMITYGEYGYYKH